MSDKLRKFITLKGTAVDSYKLVKRETGFSDEKLWHVLLTALGPIVGPQVKRHNQMLFDALTSEVETKRELIEMEIAHTKRQGRRSGPPVKIP